MQSNKLQPIFVNAIPTPLEAPGKNDKPFARRSPTKVMERTREGAMGGLNFRIADHTRSTSQKDLNQDLSQDDRSEGLASRDCSLISRGKKKRG